MRFAVLGNECCIKWLGSNRFSTERTEVILFDGADRELDRDTSVSRVDRGRGDEETILTISVASTRVPTIFRRIFVPFSILSWERAHETTLRTSEREGVTMSSVLAKEGGFAFGSNLKSAGMSYRGLRMSDTLQGKE